MNKIKLLFITHTHSAGGGAEKILTTLVNALDPKRYDITIQEIYNFNVKKEPINKNIRFLNAIIDDRNESEFNKRFKRYCIEQYPELFRAIYEWNDYDVIITWNYQCPSCLLPAFREKKTVSWIHSSIENLDPVNNLKYIKYNNQLQKTAWANVDRIVTISQKSLRSAKNIFPEFKNKMQIIYNPIDIKTIEQKTESSITNKKNNNIPFLICIGRLDKNKNFGLAIKAVKKLKDKNINCNLIIIGQGEEYDNLKNLSIQLKINDRCIFLGYKNNPYPYIANARILCMTSLAENFPTVVCEAMTLGKPFVTTPVSGASEELSNNGNCGIVADWNVDDYTKKIELLLNNNQLYNQMSNNCKKKIKEFSVENTLHNFDLLIESLSNNIRKKYKPINKEKALSKLNNLYIWNIDFATQRMRFAFDKFNNNKSILNLLKTGYHFFYFIIYIFLTPIRFINGNKLMANK